jgi:hypothetical protein
LNCRSWIVGQTMRSSFAQFTFYLRPMMLSRTIYFVLLIPLIALILGCTGEEAKLPVSGTVTLNGSPIADVNVMLIRDDGVNTMVTTDASGRFSIGDETEAEGVPAGTYKVGVTANTQVESSDIAGMIASPQLPFASKFMSPDTSGLIVTVAEDMSPIAIALAEK